MAEDARNLPPRWEDARQQIENFMREVSREMSITNMNGQVFTINFVATVGQILKHGLGKAPVFLQVLDQSDHGSLVFTSGSSTQVTVTSDVTMTVTFRIE